MRKKEGLAGDFPPGSLDQAAPDAPLAKSAAVGIVRSYQMYLMPTFISTEFVRAGATLRVNTVQSSGHPATDPFAVINKEEQYGYYDTRILNYNDDASGLMVDVSWTNSTGTTQVVKVIVFSANALGGTGLATVRINNDGSQSTYQNTSIRGYGSNANSGGRLPMPGAYRSRFRCATDENGQLGHTAGIFTLNVSNPSTIRGNNFAGMQTSQAMDGGLLPNGGPTGAAQFFILHGGSASNPPLVWQVQRNIN